MLLEELGLVIGVSSFTIFVCLEYVVFYVKNKQLRARGSSSSGYQSLRTDEGRDEDWQSPTVPSVSHNDEQEEAPRSYRPTILEWLILFLSFLAFAENVSGAILSFLLTPDGPPSSSLSLEILESFYIVAATGWLVQLFLLYSAMTTTEKDSYYPRLYFPQYILITIPGAYLAWSQVTLDGLKALSIPQILILSSFFLSSLLLFLEIFKPVKNAHLIDAQMVKGRFPAEEETASLWKIISFGWVDSLLKRGYARPLEADSLPNLAKEAQMHNVIKDWTAFKETSSLQSTVWQTLWFTKHYAFFQMGVASISTVLDFTNPFFINRLLVWIEQRKEGDSISYAVWLLMGLFVFSLIREILYGQLFLSARHWGIQARGSFIYEIFKKSLRRTGGAEGDSAEKGKKASLGKIVSLMSSDVNSLTSTMVMLHYTFLDLPISLILCLSGLIFLMGPSALAGLAVIVVSGPLSAWAMKRLYGNFRTIRKKTDRRIQVTNEALLGIRIIKYMAWEESFIDKVLTAREDELSARWNTFYDQLLVQLITHSSSILVTFTAFFTYTVIAGNTLDAATAFTSISLLEKLSGLIQQVTSEITDLLDTGVTLQRIDAFLAEPDLPKFSGDIMEGNKDKETWVGFAKGNFSFFGANFVDGTTLTSESSPLLIAGRSEEAGAGSFVLRDISVKFPKGRLSAIIGPTGAGKSSLLLTLLGEMQNISGSYSIPEHHIGNGSASKSDVAYVSQTAWLMNGTIKKNILFGEVYDEGRYLKVIKACALLRDLDILEYGDLTEIGEKGVNLSGGQKQRLSLARAAYSAAPIILLDDPLSAVDAPTARHLLNQCILDLFKGRTVFLVTHAINLVLPCTDHVVVIKNGSIFAQGTPSEILNNEMVTEFISQDLIPDASTDTMTNGGPEISQDDEIPLKSVAQSSNKEGKATEYLQSWWVTVWTDDLKDHFIALSQSIAVHTEMFTSLLVRDISIHGPMKDAIATAPQTSHDALYYILILGLISSMDVITFLISFIVRFTGLIKAGRVLHKNLIISVMGSPMRFFELTPVGRIINRFSSDINQVDSVVSRGLIGLMQTVIGGVSRVLLISLVTPQFLLCLFLLVFYYRTAIYYLASSRELKRLASISNSPIYALFGEVLAGVSTIRAFGAENQFIESILRRVDASNRATFYLFGANRWLNFRLALLSGMLVFIAGLSVILTNISGGWSGLSMIFATQITRIVRNSIQQLANAEMAMNCVERVDEYSELPQEVIESSIDIPESWPSKGDLEVKNLVVKYSPELPDVLRGISFKINPKEKIGIVGRTGAGKSTLSLAVFRILPFISGTIFIDGLDISKIGVRKLRQSLTIIPQDPILFEGSLRSNLDPWSKHSDAEIWDALKLTHFLESIQDAKTDGTTSLSLDSPVSENAGNYSQGQRQLLCLARALLRSSKFIFMDEATSSIDPDTDKKIQQTIRTEFSNGTVLTVAHRLKTIIDYDKILVLDHGSVKEYDTPFNLLQNKSSTFYNMCNESGDMAELQETTARIHSQSMK